MSDPKYRLHQKKLVVEYTLLTFLRFVGDVIQEY